MRRGRPGVLSGTEEAAIDTPGADFLCNRIRTETFPIQLFAETLGVDIRGHKPYFVADVVLDTLVFCIVVPCLLILSDFDEFSEIFVDGFKTFGHFFSCGDGMI